MYGVRRTGGNVSTHSRAEAAAKEKPHQHVKPGRFNTQPRGGSCPYMTILGELSHRFQHTAARRQLLAAALTGMRIKPGGFNTQPRGGSCSNDLHKSKILFCFNTQPRGGSCHL